MLVLMVLVTIHPLPVASATTLTFVVTSTADAHDATPGSGVCASTLPGGACTVRAAIEEANAQPSGRALTITVPAGTYTLVLGALPITAHPLALIGAGAAATTISGNQTSEVFSIASAAAVTIARVTVTGGVAPPNDSGYSVGGGIVNAGTLTVWATEISHNTAAYSGGGIQNTGVLTVAQSMVSGNYGGQGGGIYSTGTLTLAQSIIATNTANQGGGISNYRGTALLANSMLSGNTAAFNGGGIDTFVGSLTLLNTRVVSNTASGTLSTSGGGININGSTVAVTHSAIMSNTAGQGAGIYTQLATVTISESIISRNTAASGGGISTYIGTVALTNSTLHGNTATAGHGGAILNAGTLTVTKSTLSGNTATKGGAIYNAPFEPYSRVFVTNSTLSGNTAGTGGGIDNALGLVTLSYDTIASNSSDLTSEVISATIALVGTIVAGSTTSPNCSGAAIVSAGYNLESGASCGFSQPTDITNTNPLLSSLAYQGGPTQTLALRPGSPAINQGGSRVNGCPTTDQRGVSRPQGATCDIGAYEAASPGTIPPADSSLESSWGE